MFKDKICLCILKHTAMILVKFIILSFFVLGIKGDCPDGFFHAGNACYLISPDEMTEAAAQEVNISNGGPHFARLPRYVLHSVLLGARGLLD